MHRPKNPYQFQEWKSVLYKRKQCWNTGRYREQNRTFQKLFLYYAITNVKLYLPIQMLNFKYDITVLVTVQINGVQPVSTLRPSLSI